MVRSPPVVVRACASACCGEPVCTCPSARRGGLICFSSCCRSRLLSSSARGLLFISAHGSFARCRGLIWLSAKPSGHRPSAPHLLLVCCCLPFTPAALHLLSAIVLLAYSVTVVTVLPAICCCWLHPSHFQHVAWFTHNFLLLLEFFVLTLVVSICLMLFSSFCPLRVLLSSPNLVLMHKMVLLNANIAI